VGDHGGVRRRGRARLALLSGVLPLLAACGSASAPSPPTGVDQLVIPTPSVDPDDFVPRIDNPWLPLRQGARWVYQVSGQLVQGGTGRIDVRVQPGTTPVDGVQATALETVEHGATTSTTTVDYYAQDRAGNVWWLGRQGVWQAGRHGAEAGLAMPAHPRLGDGWREAYQRGVVEDREQVEYVDGQLTVPAGHFRDVLGLDATSDESPGIVEERSYAAGRGLVRSFAVDGPADLVELLSGP
jgi:hypothetical protein